MAFVRTVVAALSLVMVSVACGGDDPAGPQAPQVAGTYVGELLSKAESSGEDGSISIELPIGAELTVSQSGSEVTIAGTFSLFGAPVPIPALTGTVDAGGSFSPTGGRGLDTWVTDDHDPDCGTVTSSSSSISFAGETMRIHASVESASCSDELSGTLSRR